MPIKVRNYKQILPDGTIITTTTDNVVTKVLNTVKGVVKKASKKSKK